MIIENFSSEKRENKLNQLSAEFVVAGGGIAGVCAAITAARKGVKTILIQDRPVLGGNASSEVRLWVLGATSHMGNNNRWSREGGVMDEILIENLYKNREGNAVIFDTILLDKVMQEENITLMLNTAVSAVQKADEKSIEAVWAFNSQNSTHYKIDAPLFCDATGDGLVAFQAGAPFRIGAEAKEEFGELFAPDEAYGHLLGHSMYFYSKKTDEPVKYKAPSYALKEIEKIPRFRVIRKEHKGCNFWWFEYGGRRDTIHETEEIKYELWKVIYGVWDYIKNSGNFEDVDNMTLEWVGNVPGKRESRRFEGLYMMKQQDVIGQTEFEDAVAHGGWALDLHPADGVYSELSGCTQWHSKGVYHIPYRSFVSKGIDNLLLAGRIISASHVAFGSTRVMATCGVGAQAVGMAAAVCKELGVQPADLMEVTNLKKLQNELNLTGQSIPNIPIRPESNLLTQARVTASSALTLSTIPFDGKWKKLNVSSAQLLPFEANTAYAFKVQVNASEKTTLEVQLRKSHNDKNYSPEVILESQVIEVGAGEQTVDFKFESSVADQQYAFVTFMANPALEIKCSEKRITGVLSVFNGENDKVSNKGKQTPPQGIGVDEFEFWIPERRPEGENIAMEISPAIEAFDVSNIGNGFVRPWGTANAWVADLSDTKPTLKMEWDSEQPLSEIRLFLDTDYDHALESVQFGHPEEVIPFCLQNYTIKDLNGQVLFQQSDNYQTINAFKFEEGFSTKGLLIETEHPSSDVPAAIFEVVCL
ncbi:FAD-dependent oxidoreductase [Limibacter armeniacum]|uniref:FAD-dependent oxidoreductase n=1 Tax=Limibacter armeniacum TaxID=466084 RepID=UPI002FE5ABC7